MTFKPIYLVLVMSVFLAVVFLDQNRTPVPIKILVGQPFHLELTFIIVISMAVAAIMTLGVVHLMNKRKKKDK
jgi:uncharacterized integral membrane protein